MFELAIAGLAAGGAIALIGVCLVFSYRVAEVVNFSQTYVATFAAFVLTTLLGHSVPQGLAIVLAILVGGAVGAIQGLVMGRWFGQTSVLVRTTASIAMAIGIYGLVVKLYGNTPQTFPRLFPSLQLNVGSATVTGISIVAVLFAIVLGVVLWLVLNKTRIGIIVRAVASRPVTADLLGMRTRFVIVSVWSISAALTTAAVILVAPDFGSVDSMSLLVIPGLAAALLGGMRSFGLTIFGGLAIGVLESMSLNLSGEWSSYGSAVPFLVVSAVLLWSQRKAAFGELR